MKGAAAVGKNSTWRTLEMGLKVKWGMKIVQPFGRYLAGSMAC